MTIRNVLPYAAMLAAAVFLAVALWVRQERRREAARPAPAPHGVSTQPVLRIEQAQCRAVNEFDSGTLQVLLRNPNNFAVRLTHIELGGLPLPTFGVDLDWRRMPPRTVGADKEDDASPTGKHAGQTEPTAASARDARSTRVPSDLYRVAYWSRIEPGGEIPPDEVAMLTVKLTPRPKGDIALAFRGLTRKDQMEPEPLAKTFIGSITSPLSIARVAFDDGGKRVFVYVANDGGKARTITGLEVNGRPCSDGLWLPQREIPARTHTVIGFAPQIPFAAGDFVTVRVLGGGGAAAQVRAFWGFPMGVEAGSPSAEWGLDPTVRIWRPAFLIGPPSDRAAPGNAAHSLGGLNAMTCVVCGFGQLETTFATANEMLRRYEVARAVMPGTPVIVNPCRVEPEKGYALFAPAADALMVNPANVTSLMPAGQWEENDVGHNHADPICAAPPPAELSVAAFRHLARVGRATSAPGRFYPVLSTVRNGTGTLGKDNSITPAEFRARFYTLLAEGADGYFYRHQWSATQNLLLSLNAAILAANREAAILAPWLAVGGVRGTAKVEDGPPSLVAYTRSAADRGLLVFLIRKDAGAGRVDGRIVDEHGPTPHTGDDGHGHLVVATGKSAGKGNPPSSRSAVSVPASPVRIVVLLPAWAKPTDVSLLAPEGLTPEKMTPVEGGVAFTVAVPEDAAAYLVRFAPEGEKGQTGGTAP